MGEYPGTKVGRFKALINNHPVMSKVIIAGTVVIAIGAFVGSIETIKSLFGNSSKDFESAEYCELLEPMLVQLNRTKDAFERWNEQNLELETHIILEGNEAVKNLLLSKANLVKSDLKHDAAKLIEHYDRWLEEYKRLREGNDPDSNEAFVFVGPKGYPFPVNSAMKFRERHKELSKKLGSMPCK